MDKKTIEFLKLGREVGVADSDLVDWLLKRKATTADAETDPAVKTETTPSAMTFEEFFRHWQNLAPFTGNQFARQCGLPIPNDEGGKRALTNAVLWHGFKYGVVPMFGSSGWYRHSEQDGSMLFYADVVLEDMRSDKNPSSLKEVKALLPKQGSDNAKRIAYVYSRP